MKLTLQQIKDRLDFFYKNDFKTYILKHDGNFTIGIITGKFDDDQYIIEDQKTGKDIIAASEIKLIRKAS